MNKFIVFSISVILIFFLSFYIGMKIDTSEEEKMIEEIANTTTQNDTVEEVKPTISEDETNKEHYVLRSVDGYINVYSIDDDEKEEIYISTDIPIEYLPDTDKICLKEGIHVYSREELNEILQDFE